MEEKRKGRRDGGVWVKVKEWFGYKLHLIVDVRYEIPFAYEVTKASVSDTKKLLPMVEGVNSRHPEIIDKAKDMVADRGYDSEENNRKLYDRYGIRPVIEIREGWKKRDQEEAMRSLVKPVASLR